MGSTSLTDRNADKVVDIVTRLDGKLALAVDATGASTVSDGAILDGASSAIKATVLDLTNSNPLATAIVDASGDQITSFGGGTEYAEGATAATATGKVILWKDTGNVMTSVTATKPLPIDVKNASIPVTGTFWQATQPVSGTFWQATQPVSGTFWQATQPVSATDLDIRDLTSASDSVEAKQATGTNLHAVIDSGTITTITNSVTVSGTVTANAGTNLNTSTLALETGGNLATISGDTTSIDGKITACNTGAVVVSSGAITETNSASIKTAVELIDDAVYTDGTGTPSKGLAVMGTDGTNPQIISTNATGHVNIADGGNTITVDGTITADAGTGNFTVIQGTATNLKAQAENYQGGSAVAAANALYVQPGTSASFTVAQSTASNLKMDLSGSAANTTAGLISIKTDQTTHGTTDKTAADLYQGGSAVATGNAVYIQPGTGVNLNTSSVTVSAALPAGTNLLGKVGIDQTTPGTTNRVDVGTMPVTHIIADSGTITTVSAVTAISNALPAGTNAIGKLAANSGVDIGDVDVTSIIPGVGATNLGKAIDTALGATDTGVLALGVRDDTLNIRSGTENDVEPLHTDASGALWVDPVGNVAHDAADSGNPIKIGSKAETSPAGITLVADGDRTDLYADSDGLQMIKPYTSYGDILSERVSDTGGSSTAFTTFGATANAKNFITTIIVHNAHATTTGYVDIRDGTAGSIIATIPAPANGGAIVSFPVPLKQPTANTALAYDVSAAITTIFLTIIGFKSRVS